MFMRTCSVVVVCLGLPLILPQAAQAQFLPPPAPVCAQCTTYQPVVETRVRAEPTFVVGAQPRIGYRTTADVTSVPVTTFRNVTVDEGQYQMVWVPRPVTRQIAETAMQPQLSYRTEPFVYAEPVAQMATRLVPEQTVRYVPRTQVVLGGPLPVPASVAILMPVQSPRPAIAGTPAGQTAAAGPIPDPAFATSPGQGSSQWTIVSSRGTELPQYPVSTPGNTDYEVLPVQALVPGESVKAPSAAIVWQTPGASRGR